MIKTYEKLMQECLKLAKKANGANFPNPFVGAIVFDEKENKVISMFTNTIKDTNHFLIDSFPFFILLN